MDSLNHECTRLRAQESLGPATAQADTTVKEALEKQLEQNREQHQKQVQNLRDEIDAKQAVIDQLREWVKHNDDNTNIVENYQYTFNFLL